MERSRIVVAVDADTAGLNRGLDQGAGKVSRFGSAARKLLAGAAVVAGVRAIAGGISSVVKSASDAQQSLGATETVFGRFSSSVVRDSKRAASTFGLSANDYRDSANLIGSLFKNQGVSADQLAGKTRSMIRTGSDLAATFGGPTSQAVEALGSAFKGEFDPLERYGISLKQSQINSLLASRGQDKLTGSALRQAQQIATTDLIMRQSADSQGAFGRESNTLANVQQRLSARFANLKVVLGSAFLPALTTVGNVLIAHVLPPLEALAEKYAPKLGAALSALATRVGPKLGAFLSSIPTALAGLKSGGSGANLSEIGTNAGRLATGVSQAARSLPSFTDLLSVSSVVIGFAADHIGLLTKLMPVLALGYVGLKVSQLAANIVQAASLPTKIAEVVVNRQLVASNRALIAARGGLTTTTAAGTGVENVSVLSRARGLATLVATRVATIAAGVAARAYAGVQLLLNAVMSANPIGLVIAAIVALVAIFVIAYKKSDTFRAIVNGAWNGIKAVASAVFPAIRKIITFVFNALVIYFRTVFAIYKAVFTGAWNVIKAVTRGAFAAVRTFIINPIKAAVSFVRTSVTAARVVVGAAWSAISGATSRAFAAVRRVVVTAIAAVVTTVRGLRSKVTGIFAGAGSWLLNAGKSIIQGLINGIKNMAGAVKSAIGGVLKGARNLLPFSPAKEGPFSGRGWSLYSGRSISEALAAGLASRAAKVRSAALEVARAAVPNTGLTLATFDPAAVKVRPQIAGAGGYGGSTPAPVRLELHLTADTISAIQRGKAYRADLDAYERAGGRSMG